MANIKIKFNSVLAASDTLRSALRELDEVSNELTNIQRQLPSGIRAKRNVDRSLTAGRKSAQAIRLKGQTLLSTVEGGVEKYRAAEYRLQKMVSKD